MSPSSPSPIPIRRPTFDFEGVPRLWLSGQAVPTHLANSLSALFPLGERFFVRSVLHYAEGLPPDLRARVAGFAGQEVNHQRAHERWLMLLAAQGVEIESFLRWYGRMGYEVIEPRVPPVLRLSTTAALEHFTATLGARALRHRDLHELAHPEIARLLRWHAAEEVEHKSVAYDVLQHVDDRWIVRAGGFLLGTAVIAWFWRTGYRHLIAQEAPPPPEDLRARWRRFATWLVSEAPELAWSIARYLEPGFHPDQIDDAGLAAAFIAEMEGAAAVAA